jgi:hypothetical protein
MANNFPNISPSLNLDMVNGIYVDPRVTFTRAGGRTYYGQEVVKAEENLLIRSQEFDNASWTKIDATVTANAVTAPDGTATADHLLETAVTGFHVVQGAGLIIGQTYTLSCSIKDGGRGFAFLGDGASNVISVDLTTGAVATAAGTISNAAAVEFPLGSGWWRVSFTVTAATTFVNIYASTDGVFANRSYAGDITKGIYLWGAQAERRSTLTAYTATTTQPITRYQRLLKTAAANEWPREFDPVTGECLGRSVWESRTNLLLRSEEFDNASWTKQNITVAPNQIIAPDGTLTADKLVQNAVTGPMQLSRTSLTSGIYTASIYAKAAELGSLTIALNNAANRIEFNLLAGTFAVTAGAATGGITAVGNGWHRCTVYSSVAGTDYRLYFPTPSALTVGDGYSGIYIWGAMLETGAFATPYIPTVAAQVTRLADSAVMTGVNFSSWFNPEQGCLFMQSAPAVLDAGNGVTISDNTANNRIRLGSSTTEQGTVTVSGTAQAALDGGTPVLNTLQSVAMSYKVNDFALSLNGGAVATDTTGTVPVVTQLAFATNEYIRRLTYYPQALTSANLTAATR